MRNDLDHLPERRRAEVEYVRDIVLEEMQRRIDASRSAREKRFRILKLVLFGSFAKGTWFDDRKSGRASDYDLLVIVSHRALTDMSGFWYEVEARLLDDPEIRKEVSLIVHTLSQVNSELKDGQYFFSEIVNQGVLLYDAQEQSRDHKPKHNLAKPADPDPGRAHELASGYYEHGKTQAKRKLHLAQVCLEKKWLNEGAFELHQAAESAYRMALLTLTLYAPGTHNLKTLRRLAENIDDRLAPAWPRDSKPYKRFFELLRRAYVEARYSPNYETTLEALEWQAARIADLIRLADASCRERLARYEADAKAE